MSITVADGKSLISLLKSLQAAYDALGKYHRDLRFELKVRHWTDDGVIKAFSDIDRLFVNALGQFDDLETAALVAIDAALPSGEEQP